MSKQAIRKLVGSLVSRGNSLQFRMQLFLDKFREASVVGTTHIVLTPAFAEAARNKGLEALPKEVVDVVCAMGGKEIDVEEMAAIQIAKSTLDKITGYEADIELPRLFSFSSVEAFRAAHAGVMALHEQPKDDAQAQKDADYEAARAESTTPNMFLIWEDGRFGKSGHSWDRLSDKFRALELARTDVFVPRDFEKDHGLDGFVEYYARHLAHPLIRKHEQNATHVAQIAMQKPVLGGWGVQTWTTDIVIQNGDLMGGMKSFAEHPAFQHDGVEEAYIRKLVKIGDPAEVLEPGTYDDHRMTRLEMIAAFGQPPAATPSNLQAA